MASAYFRQFAIDHGLTVDYGYMYGKYRDFYISLKETLGSTKTLCIITNLAEDKENLKKVLSVFTEEELPIYHITDLKHDNNYLQFTFELGSDRSHLIPEFINKFIDSYIACGLEVATICPICHKKIESEQKVSIIDISGILNLPTTVSNILGHLLFAIIILCVLKFSIFNRNRTITHTNSPTI